MDSDGACSDSGQSDRSNEVGAVSPQVAAARAAYYVKGDKIRNFLASKEIQAWVELAEMRKKVNPSAYLTTAPRLCILHSTTVLTG